MYGWSIKLNKNWFWPLYCFPHNISSFLLFLQWSRISPKCFLAIRATMATYCIVLMVLSIEYRGFDPAWLLYLTSVNYIIVTGYFITATFISLHYVLSHKSEKGELAPNTDPVLASDPQFSETNSNHDPPGKQLQWYFKVYFLLFHLVISVCTLVAILFWTVILPIRNVSSLSSYRVFIMIDRHGLNLILVLVEFFLNKVPVRLLHFIYGAIVLILYILYNAIYWSASKKLIYGNVLNYEKYPGFVIGLIFGGILLLMIIQLCWFAAFRLRTRMSNKVSRNDNAEELKTVDGGQQHQYDVV